MLTDGQIVVEVLAGRRERFAILVDRYEAALLRTAQSRLGRWDWAEEAVQESLFCAFKSLHTYDSKYSFRTWLWTIVLNQCTRQHQKRQRRPLEPLPVDAAQASVTEASEEPPAAAMAQERAAQLHQLLAQLPDAQADALRLRFFGCLKFTEIADAMNCSLSTAKCRVRWGLTKLSQWIGEEDGAFHNPAAGS